MRSIRVYVELELHARERVCLPDAPARHLSRVLRLRTGDEVVLFNGDGRDYPGKILAIRGNEVSVGVSEPGDPEPDAPLQVHLGIGISKGERMDFALQKAVELGVSEVTPLFTERSVVRLSGERLAKRESHWQAVTLSACEQSGRRRIPQLHGARSLETWLDVEHPYPLLLDQRGSRVLPDMAPPTRNLTLLIGPEGGLAQGERERAQQKGFAGVRLGPRILRTETAPLAALAVVQTLWGDLRE
jgi:16S rRNA (uracil1498-N3)-methyltransferase